MRFYNFPLVVSWFLRFGQVLILELKTPPGRLAARIQRFLACDIAMLFPGIFGQPGP
jgi:hypothetical protein